MKQKKLAAKVRAEDKRLELELAKAQEQRDKCINECAKKVEQTEKKLLAESKNEADAARFFGNMLNKIKAQNASTKNEVQPAAKRQKTTDEVWAPCFFWSHDAKDLNVKVGNEKDAFFVGCVSSDESGEFRKLRFFDDELAVPEVKYVNLTTLNKGLLQEIIRAPEELPPADREQLKKAIESQSVWKREEVQQIMQHWNNVEGSQAW